MLQGSAVGSANYYIQLYRMVNFTIDKRLNPPEKGPAQKRAVTAATGSAMFRRGYFLPPGTDSADSPERRSERFVPGKVRL